MIRQGDVYWVDLGEPGGSEPGYRRPGVVVQNDLFNASRIGTTVLCVLTSAGRWASAPGNVVLDEGEANLERRSVVNVSAIYTMDKRGLVELIGRVSPARVRQILDGVRLVLDPAAAEPA